VLPDDSNSLATIGSGIVKCSLKKVWRERERERRRRNGKRV
jgi:hypothetical protein